MIAAHTYERLVHSFNWFGGVPHEVVEAVLSSEWAGRHQKGLEGRLKQARLPWIKTIEQFDFSFQPSIDRKVVRTTDAIADLPQAIGVG